MMSTHTHQHSTSMSCAHKRGCVRSPNIPRAFCAAKNLSCARLSLFIQFQHRTETAHHTHKHTHTCFIRYNLHSSRFTRYACACAHNCVVSLRPAPPGGTVCAPQLTTIYDYSASTGARRAARQPREQSEVCASVCVNECVRKSGSARAVAAAAAKKTLSCVRAHEQVLVASTAASVSARRLRD